jgi:hypothetical protein
MLKGTSTPAPNCVDTSCGEWRAIGVVGIDQAALPARYPGAIMAFYG